MEKKRISECEEQVMSIVWKCDEALTMQDLMEKVNQTFGHQWKPQTVSTFLSRLRQKGYLRMERKGRLVFYYSEVSVEPYRKDRQQEVVSKQGGLIKFYYDEYQDGSQSATHSKFYFFSKDKSASLTITIHFV